jgi:hypothetical protein
VSIILDGENCWEYYSDGGRDFLRSLYRRVVQHPHIKPVRIGDAVKRWPATDKLGHLFAGSWISHNFGIWIGHHECNRAWDLLFQAREHLRAAEKSGDKTSEQLATAWRELQIAEGSDWFWWFGDSHTSAQDSVFDRLFRKHLQNLYAVLGDEVPGDLLRPISQGHRHLMPHSQPTSLLNVKVDGRRTYFEWINAGFFAPGGSRGSMSMVQEGRVAGVYFGFDAEQLLVRVDLRGGAARERLTDVDTLRLEFLQPEGFELLVSHPSSQHPKVQLYHDDIPVNESGVTAAADQIVEIAVPLRSLGATTDDPIHFRFDVMQGDRSLERVPAEGAIETIVPIPEFELMMWQA